MPGSSRFLLDEEFERWLESQGSSAGSVGIGACFNLSNRIVFCPFNSVQGVPSKLRLGFVDLDFKCSTDSAWADGNLAEAAGQDGGTLKSKSTST